MNSYQARGDPSSNMRGLSGEENMAHSWAGFMINTYARGKDYIDVNDAAKIMEDSFKLYANPRTDTPTRKEVEDYFATLDMKRKGRVDYNDLR